jgi:HPt (histidine-containing phosphotransfer) domain-containing protein
MDKSQPPELPAVLMTVLDAEGLARLHALDPQGEQGLVLRVLQVFGASLARHAQELAQARLTQAPELARQVAHSMKSSAASAGAQALSDRAAEVEALSRPQPHQPHQPQQLPLAALTALESELQRVRTAFVAAGLVDN